MSNAPRIHNLAPGDAPSIIAGMRWEPYIGRTVGQRINAALAVAVFVIGFYVVMATSYWLLPVLILVTAAMIGLNRAPWTRGQDLGMEGAKLSDAVWTTVRSTFLRRRAADTFQGEGATAGHNTATGKPLTTASPAAVGPITWLSHTVTSGPDSAELGVVVHENSGRTSAFIEVLPPAQGHSDSDQLDSIAAGQAQMARTFGNGGSTGILQNVVTVEPMGDSPVHEWDQRDPAPGTPDVLNRSHAESVATSLRAPRYRSYMGVVIESSRLLDKIVKRKGGGDAGLAAVAADEVTVLAHAARNAGYTVVAPLAPATLITLCRSLWDHSVRVLPSGNVPSLPPSYAWPLNATAEDRWVDADGWLTSVWEVHLPRMGKPAGFDRTFLTGNPDVRRRHVLLERLTSTGEALDRYQHAADKGANQEAAADAKGDRTGSRAELQVKAAELRTDQIAAGDVGAAVVQYVIIHAQSEEELDDHERRMRTAATGCHLTMMLLYKDQARGITAGLPFGQGLR